MIVNNNALRMPLRTSKGPSTLDDCKQQYVEDAFEDLEGSSTELQRWMIVNNKHVEAFEDSRLGIIKIIKG
jgi:hypothetical protein